MSYLFVLCVLQIEIKSFNLGLFINNLPQV